MSDGNNDYGFTWGNVEVTRLFHLEGRGREVNVRPVGRSFNDGVTVYISDKGRSVRVFKNGRELK